MAFGDIIQRWHIVQTETGIDIYSYDKLLYHMPNYYLAKEDNGPQRNS